MSSCCYLRCPKIPARPSPSPFFLLPISAYQEKEQLALEEPWHFSRSSIVNKLNYRVFHRNWKLFSKKERASSWKNPKNILIEIHAPCSPTSSALLCIICPVSCQFAIKSSRVESPSTYFIHIQFAASFELTGLGIRELKPKDHSMSRKAKPMCHVDEIYSYNIELQGDPTSFCVAVVSFQVFFPNKLRLHHIIIMSLTWIMQTKRSAKTT